jgi:hypothetical protein
MSGWSYVTRVQTVLFENAGEKLRGDQVAALAGISVKTFQKHASLMVNNNHISRMKPKGALIPFYRYYLSDEQLASFQRRMERLPRRLTVLTDTDDIPDRLSFLRMLKEKTVYRDHAALALIIEDYTRTLKLRRAIENREG